jgi:hypothetical protein
MTGTVYDALVRQVRQLEQDRTASLQIIAVLVGKAGGAVLVPDADLIDADKLIIETTREFDGLRIRVRKP